MIEYLFERSPDAAVRVAGDALRAAASLASLAERGRMVPEVASESIREVFVQGHRLVYRVSREEVAILGFIHFARDFARWRRESGIE